MRGKPIRASSLLRIKLVQGTPGFQFSNEMVCHGGVCVRGWNTRVDASSSRKKSRKVVLRSSTISWSEFIRELFGWRSCRICAFTRLFL